MLYLHGSNVIQVLDISSGEPFYGTIDQLFVNYATDVSYDSTHSLTVLSGSLHELKITDWTGWTDLRNITKEKVANITWKNVQVGKQFLIATDNSSMPVWDYDNPYNGYHGEVKYKFTCNKLNNIDGKGRELNTVFNDYIISDTNMSSEYMYLIETKSGFYNIDRILCCCSDKLKGYK